MESVREILYATVLSAAYSRQAQQRLYFFTQEMWPGSPEEIDGDVYDIIFEREQTEPVPVGYPEQQANELSLYGLTDRRATLLYTSNVLPLSTNVLEALREPESVALQDKGMREIERQIRNMRTRHTVYKNVAMSQILCNGVIYTNPQRKILAATAGGAPPAGAVGSPMNWLPTGFAATNQGNLGGIIDALWSSAGALINKHFDKIDDYCDQFQIEKPANVLINVVCKQFLRNNTDFQLWTAKNGFGDAAEVLRGNMIEGLYGKRWHFVGGYWTDPFGAKQPYIPFTQAVLCPDFNSEVFKYTVGSNLLPRSIDIVSNVDAAVQNLDRIYGDFAYARLKDDPSRILLYAGMKWGFHFADPLSIFQPTVFSGKP
jgi:hypothetical protein